MIKKDDSLKLENQLCFPLYACAKEIVRKYKPFLDQIDLTYTQYITMIVLWEYEHVNVKELGQYLFLDSGTLTPLLKKLEQKGFITRRKDKDDERVLDVSLTETGKALKEKASEIPSKLCSCVNLSDDEKMDLSKILGKILLTFKSCSD